MKFGLCLMKEGRKERKKRAAESRIVGVDCSFNLFWTDRSLSLRIFFGRLDFFLAGFFSSSILLMV